MDALASSHPLSCPEEEVSDPAQINEMFDSISYSKVSSSVFFVLRLKCENPGWVVMKSNKSLSAGAKL